MELKIGVQELSRALARSQGIVEKKSTMPILSHVLLEAQKSGELTVSATDLDVAVQGQHQCESVAKEGKVAVPARHLFEIVKRRVRRGPGGAAPGSDAGQIGRMPEHVSLLVDATGGPPARAGQQHGYAVAVVELL